MGYTSCAYSDRNYSLIAEIANQGLAKRSFFVEQ